MPDISKLQKIHRTAGSIWFRFEMCGFREKCEYLHISRQQWICIVQWNYTLLSTNSVQFSSVRYTL